MPAKPQSRAWVGHPRRSYALYRLLFTRRSSPASKRASAP
jgi:hypothetical protein